MCEPPFLCVCGSDVYYVSHDCIIRRNDYVSLDCTCVKRSGKETDRLLATAYFLFAHSQVSIGAQVSSSLEQGSSGLRAAEQVCLILLMSILKYSLTIYLYLPLSQG